MYIQIIYPVESPVIFERTSLNKNAKTTPKHIKNCGIIPNLPDYSTGVIYFIIIGTNVLYAPTQIPWIILIINNIGKFCTNIKKPTIKAIKLTIKIDCLYNII